LDQIDVNKGDIAKNTSKISTLETDVSSCASTIVDVISTVETHTSSISNNTSMISSTTTALDNFMDATHRHTTKMSDQITINRDLSRYNSNNISTITSETIPQIESDLNGGLDKIDDLEAFQESLSIKSQGNFKTIESNSERLKGVEGRCTDLEHRATKVSSNFNHLLEAIHEREAVVDEALTVNKNLAQENRTMCLDNKHKGEQNHNLIESQVDVLANQIADTHTQITKETAQSIETFKQSFMPSFIQDHEDINFWMKKDIRANTAWCVDNEHNKGDIAVNKAAIEGNTKSITAIKLQERVIEDKIPFPRYSQTLYSRCNPGDFRDHFVWNIHGEQTAILSFPTNVQITHVTFITDRYFELDELRSISLKFKTQYGHHVATDPKKFQTWGEGTDGDHEEIVQPNRFRICYKDNLSDFCHYNVAELSKFVYVCGNIPFNLYCKNSMDFKVGIRIRFTYEQFFQ
jgi:predicted transcriptional regulator